jgi:hypothetical protein
MVSISSAKLQQTTTQQAAISLLQIPDPDFFYAGKQLLPPPQDKFLNVYGHYFEG